MKCTLTWMAIWTRKLSVVVPHRIQELRRQLTTARMIYFLACIMEGWNTWSCVHRCIVICDDYLSLLSDEFVHYLMGYDILTYSVWFQLDGARPHTSNALIRFLYDIFVKKILLNMYSVLSEEGFSWPPTSPGCNICDCFFSCVFEFQKNTHAIPEPQTAIQSGSRTISAEFMTKAQNSIFVHINFLIIRNITWKIF
jgi:hypothetical protein